MKKIEKKRSTEISPEETMKQLQKIFKKRGSKALEMARNEILEEKFESKQVQDALTYFMIQYWHDLARPTLLSLSCEAVGGNPELTIPIAIPMILISGAIDIHDDIIDQSKTKDGRPTVYGKFGKDIALLVGDILLFKGHTLLQQAVEQGIPIKEFPIIAGIIQKLFFELADAEALELQFRGRLEITPDEYLLILQKKAGDVEAHTRIGAILGGGSNKEIEALSQYGRSLGMLILLRDDWIDMLDLKEAEHRIKKECFPMPILYAAKNRKVKSRITEILQKQTITGKDVQEISEITQEAKGFEDLEELMQKISRDALSNLRQLKSAEGLGLLIQVMSQPPLKVSSGFRTTKF
jgi:geranylgeranyl pyrophosphate synthase